MGVLVVIGVTGSGKTKLGLALAERLGCEFRDADDLHLPANILKMQAGTPLTDADRAPWLTRVAAWIAEHTEGTGGVIACSALRRRYRDVLRGESDRVTFIAIETARPLLAERMRVRSGHFMPATLLDSQLATWERPDPDERVIFVSGEQTVAQ